ncbi:hypothetical protein [Absidia glauca]|uniref:Uncharacterized protein n=1 Tax=Absidia glauca TaxID=4829 RepID=A0A168KUA3_ABSGL|nr:hypothetical protein [Absidia glauca]
MDRLIQRPEPPPMMDRPTYFDPSRSYFVHPPPWTAPFAPFDSPPPPQRSSSDLDDMMDDRSISILRVLEDTPTPKPSHRLYYNFSDYVVVSDA